MVHVPVEAMNVTPQMGIVKVELVKVVPQIEVSSKRRHGMLLILWYGMCADGTS